VDAAEDDIHNTTSLDLSGLGATRVTSRIYDMVELRDLNLSNNKLARISPNIQYFQQYDFAISATCTMHANSTVTCAGWKSWMSTTTASPRYPRRWRSCWSSPIWMSATTRSPPTRAECTSYVSTHALSQCACNRAVVSVLVNLIYAGMAVIC
jgi:Leucine-rich repeat (LRR) protein